jgi:hypothetical protein
MVPRLQNAGISLEHRSAARDHVCDALLLCASQDAGLVLPHDRRCIVASTAVDRDQQVGEHDVLPAIVLVPSAIGDWAFG